MMIIKNGHLEVSTCEIDRLVPLASSRTSDEAEGRVVCLASVADRVAPWRSARPAPSVLAETGSRAGQAGAEGGSGGQTRGRVPDHGLGGDRERDPTRLGVARQRVRRDCIERGHGAGAWLLGRHP